MLTRSKLFDVPHAPGDLSAVGLQLGFARASRADAAAQLRHLNTVSDIGAVADLDRRHQRGIGADEGALADIGTVLGDAVVIAGDGAGADIGALAHSRIADVAEMIGLADTSQICRRSGG